jgi:hypothetical protein
MIKQGDLLVLKVKASFATNGWQHVFNSDGRWNVCIVVGVISDADNDKMIVSVIDANGHYVREVKIWPYFDVLPI